MPNREEIARVIYEAMCAKVNEIEPGGSNPFAWDQEDDDAEKGREVFRAAADAAIVAIALARGA